MKRCDFGLSVQRVKGKRSTIGEEQVFGSPAYAAPEISRVHDNKVDVYSFAIMYAAGL